MLLICIKVMDAKCVTFTSSSNENNHENLIYKSKRTLVDISMQIRIVLQQLLNVFVNLEYDMTASRRIWVVANGICIRENRNRYWSTKYTLLKRFFCFWHLHVDEHLIIVLWNVYKERQLNNLLNHGYQIVQNLFKNKTL